MQAMGCNTSLARVVQNPRTREDKKGPASQRSGNAKKNSMAVLFHWSRILSILLGGSHETTCVIPVVPLSAVIK